MRSTSSSSVVPLSARTSSEVTSPGRPVMCSSAPARENPVKVVGPRPSAPPKVAMPTIVTSTGSGVATVVVSPTARSPSLAAPRLMTTSSAVAGARPSTSSKGLSSGSSIQLPARVGGPFPPSFSPSAPVS